MAIGGKITSRGFEGNLIGTASYATEAVSLGKYTPAELFESFSYEGSKLKATIGGTSKEVTINVQSASVASASFAEKANISHNFDGDLAASFTPGTGLELNLGIKVGQKTTTASFNASHNHDSVYAAKSYETRVQNLEAKTGSYATDANARQYASNAVTSGSIAAAAAESASKAYTNQEIAKIPAATVTGVKSGDKVLALSGTELTSTLNLTYNTSNREIILSGIGGTEIGKIDASAFVKDGILYDQVVAVATGTSMEVTFPKGDKNTFTGLTNKHTYIFLEFNDGLGKTDSKTFDKLDATDLVDEYTAGNGIDITNRVVSIKSDYKPATAGTADTASYVTASNVQGLESVINTKVTAYSQSQAVVNSNLAASASNAYSLADSKWTYDEATIKAVKVNNAVNATQATKIVSGSTQIYVDATGSIVFIVPD